MTDTTRGIDVAKPVQCYFNLRTKLWSIRQRGKVRAHARWVRLERCKFHVGESSRQRVIAKRCREVHAWITGYLVQLGDTDRDAPLTAERITYNPYRSGAFHYAGDVTREVHHADDVYFGTARDCYVY